MYEDKLTYLGCFDLNNFSAFCEKSFYWNPKFTKHRHYSIMPNKLGNIMFSHSSFCFKISHMLFNFISRLILILILLNSIIFQNKVDLCLISIVGFCESLTKLYHNSSFVTKFFPFLLFIAKTCTSITCDILLARFVQEYSKCSIWCY